MALFFAGGAIGGGDSGVLVQVVVLVVEVVNLRFVCMVWVG
jgi:hypothetical protein